MRRLIRILAALFLLLSACATGWTQEQPRARPAYYVVQQGDTVDSVARRFSISERDLATWNGLPKPYKINKGQKLLLAAPANAVVAPIPKPVPSETAAVIPKPSPAPVAVDSVGPKDRAVPPPGSAQLADVAETAAAAAAPKVTSPTTASTVVPGSQTVVEGPAEEASQAHRQEVETLRQTTTNLIKLLVETGVLTREKADELTAQAKRDAADQLSAKSAPETKIIRVPYVPETVREEIKRDIRRDVVLQAKTERWGQSDAVPEWTERIKFSGDIRMRYQANSFGSNNAPAIDVNGTNLGNGLVLANTTESFDAWKYWARLGMNATISPRISAGFRITTGNIVTPISFDQTLGETMNKSTLVLDQAYLKMLPWDWMTLWFGRFPNPWFHTDLVWDPDLSMQGIAAKFEGAFRPGTRGFFTVGANPIEFVDCSTATQTPYCGRDKWLYSGQVGLVQDIGADMGFTVAAAYYDFTNLAAPFNSPTTDPLNRSNLLKYSQRGNTVYNIVTNGGNPLLGLAADYRLVNLTGSFDFKRWDPVVVNLTGDYVLNVGYDQSAIYANTNGLVNQSAQTKGYQVRLLAGQKTMTEWGDWQAFGAYKYLQRDAVVDAWTDSDFALGGTDAKGYIIGGLAGLAKNTWLRVRWISTNAISGPPRAVDVLQVDLNARF